MPKICVSIIPKNNDQALSLIKLAEEAKADFIEVRLDCLEHTNFSKLVQASKIPLVATTKLTSESGFFSGTEAERKETILTAAENGFEYADLDLSSPSLQETTEKLKQLGTKPIISYHKFDGTLSRSAMERVMQQQIASGASVCKIVTSARKMEDNLVVLNFVASQSNKAKLVCFCMGETGKISRLLSPVFGGFFTFASLEQSDETASGQMTIDEMQMIYDRIGAK